MSLLLPGLLPHAGGANRTGWLRSDWTIEPTIAIGLLALVVAYPFLTRRQPPSASGPQRGVAPGRVTTRGQKAAFIGGAATIFIALGPPRDDSSDHYLLTAHMAQHLLLIMLAAPLLLAGTPAWLLEPLTRNRVTNALGDWLTRPVIAWWPIVGFLPQWPRLPLPLHGLYFFALTIPGGLVAAFITFAAPGLYAPYDTARRIFGIDLATDQQVSGLLMWVVVFAIYLLLATVSFFRWAAKEVSAETGAVAGATPTSPEPRLTGQTALTR